MYDVGESVFVKLVHQHTGHPTKTQLKCRGPLVITEVLPADDTYRVAELYKGTASRYATTAHVSKLKVWTSTSKPSYLDDDEEQIEHQAEQDKCDEPLAV
ncbi:hypothetical protein HPB51_019062 [Rhipicephalus microplus]|uniref:Uncharacterized protein n=1 Tax=Rhipicephalus microplus TaxID=6941 RepID=A0A9J6E3F8_RHIMP|nr:hypothetical protein HPB51_019062 [Rhipicephalus microplus]